MGGGKGGSSPSSTNTIQNADPWSGVQPYLTSGYQQLNQLYAQPGPKLYPYQTYADKDPLTQASQDYTRSYVENVLPSDLDAMRSSYGTLLGAADVRNNPYLDQAAIGAIRPLVEQLQQNILPGIRGGAMQTGQYGGSRQGLAEANAISQSMRNMGDITSGMYSNAYQQGLDSLAKAMVFSPQMIEMSNLPASMMAQLGAQNEAEQQRAIDEAKYRYEYEQKLPYIKASDYMQLLQGQTGGTTTSNSSSMGGQYGSNPMMSALGGAAGGYALGSSALGTSLGMTGPWGAALGAALMLMS